MKRCGWDRGKYVYKFLSRLHNLLIKIEMTFNEEQWKNYLAAKEHVMNGDNSG